MGAKMKKFSCAAVAIAAAIVSAPVSAKTVLQPVQVGDETLRFLQGVPTLDLRQPHGGVQITPLEMDHGSYTFSVSVLNNGAAPANFDVTNFDINAGPQHLAVFSKDQLVKKAKNRAMWAQIAVAAAGGLSAAALASQRDYYHATTYTPRGVYHTTISTPSAAGQVEAAAAIAGSGVAMVSIQNRLDQTRAALGDSTVQITTVSPGDGYSGRIVIEKVKSDASPQRIDLVVNWNGDRYPFAFQIVKEGTPQPAFVIKSEPAPHAEPTLSSAPTPALTPTTASATAPAPSRIPSAAPAPAIATTPGLETTAIPAAAGTV